ncbi:NADH-quinone oxidoreductase subunit N [Candidatus Eisenbacteria bacterium]|uniref:NADH-quinone oxidoreductase subunit N n=1 Tax=Eiseniibacteriota bacterium TaxID=2212470 RepID=A0ABV6YIV0_UNCEI
MVGSSDISLVLIEIAVFALGIGVLTIDMLYRGRRSDVCRWPTLCGLALIGILSFLVPGTGLGWRGMLLADPLALFFKRLFVIAAFLVSIMMGYGRRAEGDSPGESYGLVLFATLGMLFMASAHNLVTLFMSLELLAISFYVLVASGMDRDHGLEAGVKYLVFGAVSSAFMLLGIAFIYGATGSFDYAEIAEIIRQGRPLDAMLMPGVLLLLLGLGFKISAFPFHSWAPDVYQGGPTAVVAFLSVGSKAAGFVLLQRLVFSVFLPLRSEWGLVLSLVAVLSLCLGNLGAMRQSNIKRLLGYSGIAQAGYIMLGLIAGSVEGAAAMLYYLAGYVFSNLLAFLVIIILNRSIRSYQIADYAGLARRSPMLAASLLIALLSLAGVPPLVGFFGKFLLIDAIIKAGHWWIAVVAILNVVVALYYYLSVVKVAYVSAPAENTPITIPASGRVVIYACIAVIFLLGLFQQPLYELTRTASAALF